MFHGLLHLALHFVGSAQKGNGLHISLRLGVTNFGLKCEPGDSLNSCLYLGCLLFFLFKNFKSIFAFNSPDHVQEFQTSQLPLAPCEFV
jgi:hypothetical protein